MPDFIVPDHNRYLKGIISQIREEGLRDDLLHALCLELRFSSETNVDYRGAPLYLKRNGKNYMILYTTHDEFMKHFPDAPQTHMSFDWFLEILESPVYYHMEDGTNRIRRADDFAAADGIILDPKADEFVIEGELLEKIKEFFKMDLCTIDELRQMYESLDNSRLEGLLEKSPRDWDEIIPEIGKSTILFLMDLRGWGEHDNFGMVFSFFQMNPFGYNKEISVATSNDVDFGKNQYAVIVEFKSAVDHILNFGLSGLTVSTPNGEHFLSRDLLIDKYELIEEHCTDERLKTSYQCLFKI